MSNDSLGDGESESDEGFSEEKQKKKKKKRHDSGEMSVIQNFVAVCLTIYCHILSSPAK